MLQHPAQPRAESASARRGVAIGTRRCQATPMRQVGPSRVVSYQVKSPTGLRNAGAAVRPPANRNVPAPGIDTLFPLALGRLHRVAEFTAWRSCELSHGSTGTGRVGVLVRALIEANCRIIFALQTTQNGAQDSLSRSHLDTASSVYASRRSSTWRRFRRHLRDLPWSIGVPKPKNDTTRSLRLLLQRHALDTYYFRVTPTCRAPQQQMGFPDDVLPVRGMTPERMRIVARSSESKS